jgi:hypothetical protein
MTANQNGIIMGEVTDPRELVTARAQDERFERNFRWFQSHTGRKSSIAIGVNAS